MLADPAPTFKGNWPSTGLYSKLMVHAAGLPNDDLFAQMIASQVTLESPLPYGLGLTAVDFIALMNLHFPGFGLHDGKVTGLTDTRDLERDDVYALLLENCASNSLSEKWMARIVTTACMSSDHLWQDLGLASRKQLSRLMTLNFPALSAKNVHDMKWKKFLYKQMCENQNINTCRSPSCEYCTDYLNCFGTED